MRRATGEHYEEDKYKMENNYLEGRLQADDAQIRRDEYRRDDDYRRDDYQRDDYRQEERYERDEYRDDRRDDSFVDDAARWTGRRVQDVEDIPGDVRRKWDNAVDDVEDAPERRSHHPIFDT